MAESLVATLNTELAHRVTVHKQAYDVLWKDSRATPEDILAALGTNARLLFAVSVENKNHLSRCAQLVGKTLDDFLPPEYQTTPRGLVIHDDGRVTLEP